MYDEILLNLFVSKIITLQFKFYNIDTYVFAISPYSIRCVQVYINVSNTCYS